MLNDDLKRPAAIQYHGIQGISQACIDAVINLLQVGGRISAARVVSAEQDHGVVAHGLILTVGVGDLIAIKSGFASGYAGEAPSALSYTLALLDSHGIDILMFDVDSDFVERLDNSALTTADIEWLDHARRSQHSWTEYVQERHWEWAAEAALWGKFPRVIPFAIVDRRIIDLAKSFWDEPDARLLTAYRRLEDIVRARIGVDEHGARLFSQAFAPSGGKLQWHELSEAERGARAQLFSAAYTAFRNARAHREQRESMEQQLAEFLLVNQLYRLERTAVEALPVAGQKPKHSRAAT